LDPANVVEAVEEEVVVAVEDVVVAVAAVDEVARKVTRNGYR
jgi:hypothetical protein